MKYLVYGAGTIGTTYAYLLSQTHDVDLLIKREQLEKFSGGVAIALKDLRKKSKFYEKTIFYPNCVTEIEKKYDGILVAVNRYQLKDVLPLLEEKQQYTNYFAFMQNNWNIQKEIEQYLMENKYVIAFPSSVGGGRDEKGIEAILFDEATRLGGQCQSGINDLQGALKQVGIKTQYDKNIFDWLKVHYLQQSITAGAVAKSGDFQTFAHNYHDIKKMAEAFREGIEVCRLQGVKTYKIFPANLFKLPLAIVAHIMQKMFLEPNTIEMVNNHMKKGLPEWIVGYKEVLADGLKMDLPMTVWRSYDKNMSLKYHVISDYGTYVDMRQSVSVCMKEELDAGIEESIQQTRNGFENSFLEGKFYERQTKDDGHLQLLLKEIRGEGTEHILDLGTGTGYLALPMAEQYPECQIYGLDIVNETILRNQKKASDLKNCHFISYDGRKFPFQDCFFDRVVSRYALHHFPAIEETFWEIGRVLKQGGLLLVSDPVPNSEDENRFVDQFMKMKPDGHIRFYSEEEFVRLAEKAGFRKKKSVDTSITFPRKQAELYEDLIQSTPPTVLESYQIEIKNGEIWITEKVVNLVFEKI